MSANRRLAGSPTIGADTKRPWKLGRASKVVVVSQSLFGAVVMEKADIRVLEALGRDPLPRWPMRVRVPSTAIPMSPLYMKIMAFWRIAYGKE